MYTYSIVKSQYNKNNLYKNTIIIHIISSLYDLQMKIWKVHKWQHDTVYTGLTNSYTTFALFLPKALRCEQHIRPTLTYIGTRIFTTSMHVLPHLLYCLYFCITRGACLKIVSPFLYPVKIRYIGALNWHVLHLAAMCCSPAEQRTHVAGKITK